MGWIKTAGLAVVLFGICFMAFFTMFDEMESTYGSDYNSTSNGALERMRANSTSEIDNSYTQIQSHQGTIENGTIASADAEDNLIASGFSIVKDVFSYPFQMIYLGGGILQDVFGLDTTDNNWLFNGLYFIVVFLTMMAILTVIFKVNF